MEGVLPTIGQDSGAPTRDFAIYSGRTPSVHILSPTLPDGLPMSVLMTMSSSVHISSFHPTLNSLLLSQLAECCEYLSQKDPKHESSLLCPPKYFTFILFIEDITTIYKSFLSPQLVPGSGFTLLKFNHTNRDLQ